MTSFPAEVAPAEHPAEEYAVQRAPLVDVPCWQLAAHEVLVTDLPPPPPPPEESETALALSPPEFRPLCSWQALLPRMRRAATEQVERRELDVEALIQRLSSGRAIENLPRKRRWRWGDRVQVIQDRSQHLVPYWRDQDLVLAALRRLYPPHGFQSALIHEGLPEPVFPHRRQGPRRYRPPAPGSLVLVLGDLACMQQGGEHRRRLWAEFGRRLAQNGNRLLALVPCPVDRCLGKTGRDWQVLPWEKPRRVWMSNPLDGDQPAARARRLLRLLSPAIRVEPDLLRAIRRLLTDVPLDAGTESDVWQHPAVASSSRVAATLDPDEARELRREFAGEPEGLRRQVLELIYRWRTELPREIWFEEVLSLDTDSQRLLPDMRDPVRSARFFDKLPHELQRPAEQEQAEGATRAWIRRWSRRLPPTAWLHEQSGPALRQLWWIVHRFDQDADPPPGFDPREIPAESAPVQHWSIAQVGSRLSFVGPAGFSARGPLAVGSLFAHIRSRNLLVHVAPLTSPQFWKSGQPPAWAVDWGEDEFGWWVAFEVAGVRQRMRWIPPGMFRMGSPHDEPERFENEGPQHEVTISRGFWLFDTACTQALWQAVMGENPSRFKGLDRPVEQVSWEDCQQFFAKINESVPGLDLSLPTEGQWEYACRAGTTAPFSFGSNITTDQVNYNGNFPYRGGDKGLYRRQTVPVASLPPNPWGLYEMHGNVYEWCHDGLRRYSGHSVTDPIGSRDRGAERALRGGCWFSYARYVRCAFRSAIHPGNRSDYFGFRPARVQQSDAPVAEPAGPALGRTGAARPTQDQPGGAELVRLAHVAPSLRDGNHVTASLRDPNHVDPSLRDGNPVSERPDHVACPLPQARAFVIATDCEKLTFRQITRPEWASAIGRDRFGLWAEFEVSMDAGPAVAQRMRWIPPGRFLMGSPSDEPGRPTPEEIRKHSPHWPDEGPQHLVTISQGYWLFDTPCVQWLWEAIMSDNPSRFKTPDRPVEQVSWDDCQAFLEKINQRVPGLDLTLPTEAQWEYACRAGTDAATYAGPLEILGESNAPALDAIAWYGGNSGVDFDLNDGEDASQWPNKQYDHQQAGTHPVRLKHPNPWGLYDVLGNVWEWCSDGPRQYTDEPAVDPVGPIGGAGRSLRGGGWDSDARDVRCAFRDADPPGLRFGFIGFRPARVQQSAAPGAEPAGPALGRMGAARPTQDQPGEASRTKRWWPWSRNR